MATVDTRTRQERKAEGRKLKRQKIEDGGGVRPRPPKSPAAAAKEKTAKLGGVRSNKPQPSVAPSPQASALTAVHHASTKVGAGRHRFGRVMDQAPCPNKPRFSTLSIALPGSVVSNCQTRELKTHLVGQIARAATIYHVDEIIVFDDNLSISKPSHHGKFESGCHRRPRHEKQATSANEEGKQIGTEPSANEAEGSSVRPSFSDPHTFMARVLQYCECPQYLRRHFFPMHPDLQFAGLLPPVDAPHHVRANDRSPYREGVVLDKLGPNGGSLVNCGIRNRPVEINTRLTPGIRCTLQLDPSIYTSKTSVATVVSPTAPRESNGTYWGYTTRLATSIKAVWDECPYEGGYDLKIGTSERGRQQIDSDSYSIPRFQHALVVFGGVAGIEECVDADESIKVSGSMSYTLFDQWVNVCQLQGSRTIRTEEAVLISLAKLSPLLSDNSYEVQKKTQFHSEIDKSSASAAEAQGDLNDDRTSEGSSGSDSD